MDLITEDHILYQDQSIIVINKPIGLAIHKNEFMARDADYVLKAVGDLLQKRIYNVHRLDSKTSGVLVMAFSSKDASLVSKQFENHQVQKTYYALVRENPGEGTFDADVVHQNKRKRVKALTHYKTIKSVQTSLKYRDFENIQMSLVEAKPETGRWHQLRQHFAGGRFDIIGDTKHGDFTLNRIVADETGERRLMLHAGKLEFAHPHTGESMVFEAPVPAEFEEVMVYFQQKHDAGEVIMERPKE